MSKKNVCWEIMAFIASIVILIGFAIYVTKSLLPLFALLVLTAMRIRRLDTIKTKCPKCGCEFLAEALDEDEKSTKEIHKE